MDGDAWRWNVRVRSGFGCYAMAYKPPANLSKTFLDRPPPNWKDLTLQVTNAVKAVDAAVRGRSQAFALLLTHFD